MYRIGVFSPGNLAQAAVQEQLVPETDRCEQCAICLRYGPTAIDIRRNARLARPVINSHCLVCVEWIALCSRVVLQCEKSFLIIFAPKIGQMN